MELGVITDETFRYAFIPEPFSGSWATKNARPALT
jgi:hypothetical protein